MFDEIFSRSQTPFVHSFREAPQSTFFSGSVAKALIVIHKHLSN
jgi:hypothetical protein